MFVHDSVDPGQVLQYDEEMRREPPFASGATRGESFDPNWTDRADIAETGSGSWYKNCGPRWGLGPKLSLFKLL